MTKKAKRKTAEEMELELGLATRSVTMEELMERWNSKRPSFNLGDGGRGPFRRCSLKKASRGRYNLTMTAWRGDENRVLRKVDVFDEDGDFIFVPNLMASQIEACAWQHDLLGPDREVRKAESEAEEWQADSGLNSRAAGGNPPAALLSSRQRHRFGHGETSKREDHCRVKAATKPKVNAKAMTPEIEMPQTEKEWMASLAGK